MHDDDEHLAIDTNTSPHITLYDCRRWEHEHPTLWALRLLSYALWAAGDAAHALSNHVLDNAYPTTDVLP